jgi:hypothetical protein
MTVDLAWFDALLGEFSPRLLLAIAAAGEDITHRRIANADQYCPCCLALLKPSVVLTKFHAKSYTSLYSC